MIKFIAMTLLAVFSTYSLASELTLTASQSKKIKFEPSVSYYQIAVNLPSDLEVNSSLVTSIFEGGVDRIESHLEHESPGSSLEPVGSVAKGKTFAVPLKQAVEPNPVIYASEFIKLVRIQFEGPSKHASDKMDFVHNAEDILRTHFDEVSGVEIWRTRINYPIPLLPQPNPFTHLPPEPYGQFSDLGGDQKKTYKDAYKHIFDEIKEELEEKCKIIRGGTESCKINQSKMKITDKLLKTGRKEHYFLELQVEATW